METHSSGNANEIENAQALWYVSNTDHGKKTVTEARSDGMRAEMKYLQKNEKYVRSYSNNLVIEISG